MIAFAVRQARDPGAQDVQFANWQPAWCDRSHDRVDLTQRRGALALPLRRGTFWWRQFPFLTGIRRSINRRSCIIHRIQTHTQTPILISITFSAGPTWSSDMKLKDWQATGFDAYCRYRLKPFAFDSGPILRHIGSRTGRNALTARALLIASMETGSQDGKRTFRFRKGIDLPSSSQPWPSSKLTIHFIPNRSVQVPK